jgi:glyoxylase-like metal-dependent hydrolase (beta-lactamase superfamily II)
MLEGSGGNIAASVGDDGIVIVDDQFAPLADKIRAALAGLTDKPLRFIINTHYHFDHTGGNLPLHDATIVAHDNVRKRLAQSNVLGNGGSMKMEQPANPQEALPVITFQHDVTLHVNSEDIRALHAPHGHTDGDSIVFFPKSNVVHFGDVFVRYGFPFVDINGGGSTQGMITGIEAAIAQLPADVKVIPGHGALATLTDVRDYVKLLQDTRAVVEKGVKGGKTLEQLKQEKVLAPWQKYSGQFVRHN